jgi:carbon monoxide dehydrogenase subunit G
MNYQGTQLLPHPPEHVWQALLDPEVLRACIAGCEQFERVGENDYKSIVKIAVGPVSARFTSTVTLADVVPPQRCTLQFAGQGGVAGFGKGEARVQLLVPAGGSGTQLDWSADAHVGGRLAQIGSRLIEATVRKMSEDFFLRFAAQLAQPVPRGGEADGAGRANISEAPKVVPADPSATAPAKPGAKLWARLVTAALALGLVWWLCFKG